MSATWDYEATARILARYFAAHAAGEGEGYAGWRNGLAAADAWVALLAADPVRHEDLTKLDLLIRAGDEEDGTAWTELRLAYLAWRREQQARE
jgi:hypothetical protein